jgi:multidrug efflux pump subunit AcrB
VWFKQTPTSFLPDEDQGVVFADVRLPEGAAKARTEEVMHAVSDVARAVPGVQFVQAITGFSMMGGRAESVGFVIIGLTHWAERHAPDLQAAAIMNTIRGQCATITGAELNFFMPPSIPGLGANSGLDIRLQALTDSDPAKLDAVLQQFLGEINRVPGVLFAFSGFSAKTPSVRMNVDRLKCEMLDVPVAKVFATLQNYFGSYYVNDVNLDTQVNQVIIQSDWAGRRMPEDALKLYVRSSAARWCLWAAWSRWRVRSHRGSIRGTTSSRVRASRRSLCRARAAAMSWRGSPTWPNGRFPKSMRSSGRD